MTGSDIPRARPPDRGPNEVARFQSTDDCQRVDSVAIPPNEDLALEPAGIDVSMQQVEDGRLPALKPAATDQSQTTAPRSPDVELWQPPSLGPQAKDGQPQQADTSVALPPGAVTVAYDAAPEWSRLPSGRWAVGDHGRQEEIVPLPALPRHRPDTVIDGAHLEALTFRAACLRGLSHQQYGRPRQDSYAYEFSDDSRWLVACVADGVSEGERSHEAADIAVSTIVARLAGVLADVDSKTSEELDALPWQKAVHEANRRIILAAQSQTDERVGHDFSEVRTERLTASQVARLMSTTAIVLAVSTQPNGSGHHIYGLALAAGDSSAFKLSAGFWTPLTATKTTDGGIVSSSVRPLPEPHIVKYESGWLEPGECLVLMTDGLGDPLGSGTGVVGRFLEHAWAKPPDLLSFACQLGFLRKTYTDDRTAFAVWADLLS